MTSRDKLPVSIYTPDSQMRTPLKLLQHIYQNIRSSRELGWRLFVRDFSAKYRQSLLGIFWAFVPPIAVGLVFVVLQSRKVVDFGETDIPYPVFALVGTTLWQLFTESLNAPLVSLKNAKPMLARINFPHEALLISAFYNLLINFLIKSLVLLGILLFFQVKITLGLLLAPLAIFMLILLGITFGLFLTPLGMLYTDITSALPLITQLWFFLSPVIYPPPKSFPFSLLSTINPVSPILVGARELITKGYITNIQPFLITSGLAIIALIIAWIACRISLPIIVERMSS